MAREPMARARAQRIPRPRAGDPRLDAVVGRLAGALRAALVAGWPFVACLALALALRLAVIPPRPVVDVAPLIGDEGNYFGIAQSLAAGNGIPDRWAWTRPPGYPLLLAALLRLTGGDPRAMLLMQAVAGTALVATVALVAGQLWGRRATLLAAAWAALDPSLVYYTRVLHTETLYMLFLALLALCLVRWAQDATPHWLAGGAVLAGLAAVLRSTILAALPLLAGWILWRAWRRWGPAPALRRAALFVGLWAATIAPVTIYNWQAYNRFILLDTTLGYNLWRDHRDGSLPELHDTLTAIPNPGDRHRFALRQGLAWIAAHPAETLRKSAIELYLTWGEPFYVDEALGKQQGVSDLWRNGVHLLTLLLWLALVPLALRNAWRARDPAPLVPLGLLAIASPSIGVALSHSDNRFVLPALPLLIALAAGVVAAPATVTRTRRRALGATASIALFLLLAFSVSGGPLQRRGEIAARYALGRAAEWTGRDAAGHYTALLERHPALSEPHLRLALLARARGDDAAALDQVGRALERDADNFRARALGARVYRARGQDAEARQLLARGGPTAPAGLAWAWEHEPGTPPPRLVLDGTDSDFARGFYGPERGEGGRAFRWMGDRAQLRLAPPPGDPPRALALTLASPAPPGSPVEATILVNGREAGRVAVIRERGWNDLRVPLPPDIDLAQPLTVELRAPTLRRPDDRRALGLAVSTAALETEP